MVHLGYYWVSPDHWEFPTIGGVLTAAAFNIHLGPMPSRYTDDYLDISHLAQKLCMYAFIFLIIIKLN